MTSSACSGSRSWTMSAATSSSKQVEQLGDIRGGEGAHEVGTDVFVQVLEDPRLLVAAEGTEHPLDVLFVELFDDVGLVGRVVFD